MCVYDHKDPCLIHDVQWFANKESFMNHADMNNQIVKEKVMGFVSKYDASYPFTGEVYGDWDQKVIDITSGMGAKFTFVKTCAGQIRDHIGGLKGPPVIVAS